MPVRPPDDSELQAIAEHYRLGLSDKQLVEFAPFVTGLLSSWDALETLYARTAPPRRDDRKWHRPDDPDNPLGAWYVRTEITEGGNGPLAGRTVAIKDNTMVAGVPMMNGSETVEGFIPTRDATVVSRLLAAGATITGKAVCEDLCFSGSSFTSRPAPVLNPWDLSRSSGGSSSGSAALVASGGVDMATGGDQGGSVRIPSAFSGIVGHKPTHGLVPYTGAFPIELTIDHLGPMTRTVADAALMLTVMAGYDGLDPRQPVGIEGGDYVADLGSPAAGLRIGIVAEGFGTPVSDPGVDDAVRGAIETLRSAGLAVDEVSVPWHADAMHVWNVIATEGATAQMVDGNAYGRNYFGLYDPELIEYYGRQWRERAARVSPAPHPVLLSRRAAPRTPQGPHHPPAPHLAHALPAAH